MVEFSVLNVELKKELVEYKEYNTVVITLPNLELYEVNNVSVINFNNRIHYELNILFWNPLISLRRTSLTYVYTLRIYNTDSLQNVPKVRGLINRIFETFPFIRKNNKRKQLSFDDNISNKLTKLNLKN